MVGLCADAGTSALLTCVRPYVCLHYRYQDAAAIRDRLNLLQARLAELDAAGADRAPPPQRALRLGQRVVHAEFGYRGAVFGCVALALCSEQCTCVIQRHVNRSYRSYLCVMFRPSGRQCHCDTSTAGPLPGCTLLSPVLTSCEARRLHSDFVSYASAACSSLVAAVPCNQGDSGSGQLMTAGLCRWDQRCCETEQWQQRAGVGGLRRGAEQPFYHVLVDQRDWPKGASAQSAMLAYVPEELLEAPEVRSAKSKL